MTNTLSPDAQPLGDIIQADAIDLMHSLDPSSVAAIVADPPYGIAYHSNRHQEKNPHAPIAQDWDFQIGVFLDAAMRSLMDGGALYLFTRWDVYPLWARSVPTGLALKNMIVWDKGAHSSGDLTGNFGFRHELIMFIVKGRHKLKGHRHANVWNVRKISHKKMTMPAEKPIELYERAILSSSNEGDFVVDPFSGSGTLAAAAQRHGRRYLAGDIDKEMVRMGRKRVGLSVGDEPEQTTPLAAPCPVFQVSPPCPALWGVHPEDIVDWRAGRVVEAEGDPLDD